MPRKRSANRRGKRSEDHIEQADGSDARKRNVSDVGYGTTKRKPGNGIRREQREDGYRLGDTKLNGTPRHPSQKQHGYQRGRCVDRGDHGNACDAM